MATTKFGILAYVSETIGERQKCYTKKLLEIQFLTFLKSGNFEPYPIFIFYNLKLDGVTVTVFKTPNFLIYDYVIQSMAGESILAKWL